MIEAEELKIDKKKITPLSYILVICFAGFVTGVLLVVFSKENIFVRDGLLEQKFLWKMQEIDVDKREIFFVCLGERLRSFFLLLLLSYSSVNILFQGIFFGMQGFYTGTVMELLAVRYGGKGIVFYLEMIFPHGLFYFTGFLILGCWCLQKKIFRETGFRTRIEDIERKNRRYKICLAFFLVIVGIIMESYVNTEIY